MNIYVKDLIKASFRVIGVLAKTEAPTDDEYADSLQALNFMLDSWSVRNLMVLGTILEQFPLTAGTLAYNIGTGQTFNTTKPSAITSAFVRDAAAMDTVLDIAEPTTYWSISDKSGQGLPTVLFYDPGYTQQNPHSGVIYLYPVPDQAYTLFIGQQKPLTEFDSIEDLVTLQSAYYEAIKYALAVRLYREFHEHDRPVPSDIIALAEAAVHTLETMNSRQILAASDLPGAIGGYDIYSDEGA